MNAQEWTQGECNFSWGWLDEGGEKSHVPMPFAIQSRKHLQLALFRLATTVILSFSFIILSAVSLPRLHWNSYKKILVQLAYFSGSPRGPLSRSLETNRHFV